MSDPIFVVSEGDVSYEMLLPDSDVDYIQSRIRDSGAPYEAAMLRDMARHLRPGDKVLDVGANVGNHTLYLARIVGCHVVAFEPNAHLARAITDSAALNGLTDRITVHAAGVGSVAGMAHFQRDIPENLGGQSLELGQGDIPVITLDGMDFGGPVRAIKIDVEGSEREVLEGGRALIARDRPIIYAECANESRFVAVAEWLETTGYALCQQFHDTQTHLFIPAEQLDMATYSRQVVRPKTVDLYVGSAKLKTTTEDLHAASVKARTAGLLVTQLNGRIASLQFRLSQLESENASLRRSYQGMREKLLALQKSRTYRTGQAIRESLSSPRGLIAMPIRLLRVLRSAPATPSGGAAGLTSAPPFIPPPLKVPAELIAENDFVVLAGTYPSATGDYGGEFVRSRAEGYAAGGLSGMVVELNRRNRTAVMERDGPLCVLRAHPAHLDAVIAALHPGRAALLVHSPTPDMQTALIHALPGRRLLFWFHGSDLRDYRRLFFNFDTAELEKRRASLDLINRQRWEAARLSFATPGLTTIFVSDFLRRIATRDVGTAPLKPEIIPNFIDGDFYRPVRRDPSLARRILMLRSFKARNYGYDIAVEAIHLLSDRPGFADLTFTIRGFGENFTETTAPLRRLTNVVLEERYSTPEEMRELHARHGIALCPTRHDTQGVSLGEAMASGMACITHDIAAIPEFADDGCAVLVRPDDPGAYAEAIWALAHDPERVRRLGTAAAERVRAQCGAQQTIRREEDLIRAAATKEAEHDPQQ